MQAKTQPMMLSGIKVLDFGRLIAAPFVGQVLSDLGADVIKIEQPVVGDQTRATSANAGKSSLFTTLNRNKRSLAIDLAHPQAKLVFSKLLPSVDVVVHNFRVGAMERRGLAPTDIWKINPRVVCCSISGFGDGPLRERPANDVIIQAFAGLMSFTGDSSGPYVRVPVPVADYTAGFYGLIGILSALVERNMTGRGRLIETSLVESLLTLEGMHMADYLKSGQLPPRLASANVLEQPNEAFPTSDGAIVIAITSTEMWRRCARAIGAENLADDPRYATRYDRLQHKDELGALVGAYTSKMNTLDCAAALEAADVICSPIQTLADVANHPHIRALGILQRAGDLDPEIVTSALTIDGVRPKPQRPAPALGQDARDILDEASFSASEIQQLYDAGVVFPSKS